MFSTIAIIANLKLSLTKFFAQAISLGSETLISISRIQDFLHLDEIDASKFIEDLDQGLDDVRGNYEILCVLHDASFKWPRLESGEDQSTVLQDINFVLRRGEITGVCGAVGSGKSTLALGVMQELDLVKGTCSRRQGITTAYCSQIPWILGGTIRDNILFGCIFDQEWMNHVLNVCQLVKDVASFPDG